MTEKRFECDKGSRIIIDNETNLHYIMTLDWECNLVTKLLNHFSEENEQLKSDAIYWSQNAEARLKEIDKLRKENKQLKERNNRQAKQLDNLYTLIEKQDWKTLKGLIQEFQECEEQLQQEWGTYGDVE